eukprot:jgi/Chrzof1/14682/Cz09g11270.t1
MMTLMFLAVFLLLVLSGLLVTAIVVIVSSLMVAAVVTTLVTTIITTVLTALHYEYETMALCSQLSKDVYNPIAKVDMDHQCGLEWRAYIQRCTKVVYIAFRGTTSGRDIYTDMLLHTGSERLSPRFSESLQVVQSYKEKYPTYQIFVTGHSLGGSIAIWLSQQLGVQAVTFNAHVTGTWVWQSITRPYKKVTMYYMYDDPIALKSNKLKGARSICLGSQDSNFNLTAHYMDNFTQIKSSKQYLDMKRYGNSHKQKPDTLARRVVDTAGIIACTRVMDMVEVANSHVPATLRVAGIACSLVGNAILMATPWMAAHAYAATSMASGMGVLFGSKLLLPTTPSSKDVVKDEPEA